MQQSHKMGYAEYSRKLDNRLAVEKRRHQEYEKGKFFTAKMNKQVYK